MLKVRCASSSGSLLSNLMLLLSSEATFQVLLILIRLLSEAKLIVNVAIEGAAP
ncbi:MAG: hypothetical protein HYX40_04260 [Sphingobacteriales bacterium]|nr:hypothetical protein [Sphingobacteriales bacterium]